jgi:hypothetical protein
MSLATKRASLFLATVAMMTLPLAAIAQSTNSNTNASTNSNSSTGLSGGAAIAMTTPLGKKDLEVFIGSAVKSVLGATGVIALIMFVWGGFLWMTAGGNTELVKKAKGTVVWASIGLVVVFASYAIVQFIISALNKV